MRSTIYASALLAASSAAAAPAQSHGHLSFMTVNVAGLPAFLNGNGESGDKTSNTAQIGQRFAKYGYDLVHVQEDFNYHATLYANDKHPYRTPTSGGVPSGSGLNTLSNYNWNVFDRIKWDKCDIDGGDCLTPKGYTFMRVNIAPDVSIDLYNLHADAGDQKGDGEARTSNIKQVVDAINQNSQGQAVIVGGDTNSRYTRTGDGIRQFRDLAGLSDAWIQLIKGGVYPNEGSDPLICDNPSNTTQCEIVDKVLFRDGDHLSLKATAFQYAGHDFLQADGNVLTDHDPVLVNFRWQKR